MALIEYAVHLASDPDGGFVVTCRDLPALITQGESLAHALSEASDAMEEVVALYLSEGIALPTPTAVRGSEHVVSPSAAAASPFEQ
jgi:antitoxin HicB